MLNWRLYLFKSVLLYFRSKALFIYLQRFCFGMQSLGKDQQHITSINVISIVVISLFGDVGLGHWSTTEQHLWLFILSRASLPTLTTMFHPPASVSWVCGIAEVCATAPARHSYHKLKWKNWTHLELICCWILSFATVAKEKKEEKVPLQRVLCAVEPLAWESPPPI